MKKLLLIPVGLLPLAAGALMEYLIWQPEFKPGLYLPIAVLFLAIWGLLGYFLCWGLGWGVLPYIHLPAAICWALLLIQNLLLHQYWANAVGHLTQLFFLSIANFGSTLLHPLMAMGWTGQMWAGYTVCLGLLLLAFAAGGTLSTRARR